MLSIFTILRPLFRQRGQAFVLTWLSLLALIPSSAKANFDSLMFLPSNQLRHKLARKVECRSLFDNVAASKLLEGKTLSQFSTDELKVYADILIESGSHEYGEFLLRFPNAKPTKSGNVPTPILELLKIYSFIAEAAQTSNGLYIDSLGRPRGLKFASTRQLEQWIGTIKSLPDHQAWLKLMPIDHIELEFDGEANSLDWNLLSEYNRLSPISSLSLAHKGMERTAEFTPESIYALSQLSELSDLSIQGFEFEAIEDYPAVDKVLANFPKLVTLNLNNCAMWQGNLLSSLLRKNQLLSLQLKNASITDATLNEVLGADALEDLNLAGTIIYRGLEGNFLDAETLGLTPKSKTSILNLRNLRQLNLAGHEILNLNFLKKLVSLSNLTQLNIVPEHHDVGVNGYLKLLNYLARALPQLTETSLPLNHETIGLMARSLPGNLTTINLYSYTHQPTQTQAHRRNQKQGPSVNLREISYDGY